MSKKKHKRSKNKYNKHTDTYYVNNKNSNKYYVSSKEIQAIAFKVFGSTYYTPDI